MSQGIIIRKNGKEKPSKMDDHKDTVKCSCEEEFIIYHHRAHPESVEEQKEWLVAELKNDHSRNIKHRDSYRFPR